MEMAPLKLVIVCFLGDTNITIEHLRFDTT